MSLPAVRTYLTRECSTGVLSALASAAVGIGIASLVADWKIFGSTGSPEVMLGVEIDEIRDEVVIGLDVLFFVVLVALLVASEVEVALQVAHGIALPRLVAFHWTKSMPKKLVGVAP